MKTNLESYIDDVKRQLVCNASLEFSNQNITFNYTEADIAFYLDYFQKCHKFGLSAYKSLTFFQNHINDGWIPGRY